MIPFLYVTNGGQNEYISAKIFVSILFIKKFKHNPATFPISGNAAIRIGFLSNFGL
jgi:hypothetical protein